MVQEGNSDNKVNPIGTRRVRLHLNVKEAQVKELYHAHASSSRRLERSKHCHSVDSPTTIFVCALRSLKEFDVGVSRVPMNSEISPRTSTRA